MLRPTIGKKVMHLHSTKSLHRKESSLGTLAILIVLLVVAFIATYTSVAALLAQKSEYHAKFVVDEDAPVGGAPDQDNLQTKATDTKALGAAVTNDGKSSDNFCRGIPHLELWGEAVKQGTTNLVDSSEACCTQCKELCPEHEQENCKCNAWVYCGDKDTCGSYYRQCWLKKMSDVLKPDIHNDDPSVPWTSGIVHPKDEGVIALISTAGTIRIKLHSTWSPHAVMYVRRVLAMRVCTGCQLYRAEGLGQGWDKEGNRTENPPGPPYALLQGSLQADGVLFKELAKEATPVVRRGMVCLIGGGPDFFISLAHHPEWGQAHTVFGEVVEEDMALVDSIVAMPTKAEKWGDVDVRVLEEPLNFKVKRHRAARS